MLMCYGGLSMGIVVENGAIYYIDENNQTFSCGSYAEPIKYEKANLIIGTEGVFTLPNGKEISIGTVTEYCR